MGVSSKKPLRTVTFPCISHPNTDRMEKLLNKVKIWGSNLSSSNPSVEIVCSGFSHLTVLYECLEDLFNTNHSQTNSPIISNHTENWTDRLLDVSVKLLDICYNTTDIMSHIKHLRDLGCDLRRNRGSNTETMISRYIEFRNRMKKDIKASMANLKQVENMIQRSQSQNNHQMWMISVFREVKSFSILVFRLLLEFLAIAPPRRRRTHRFTVVSRFLSNSKVVPENKVDTNGNELKRIDAELLRYCPSEKQDFLQVVPKNLESLETTLEGINSNLHLLSRRLIATIVSILYMISF